MYPCNILHCSEVMILLTNQQTAESLVPPPLTLILTYLTHAEAAITLRAFLGQ